jgi:hypothetical protein
MTSETRYFRSDTEVVNAVTYYKLLISLSGSQGTLLSQEFVKFAVYVYHADGTTALLGTTTAIDTDAIDGMYSVNWNCPQTNGLASTDRVLIIISKSATSGGTFSTVGQWITEQLGAGSLDAATWTFYYYSHYYESIRVIHAKDCEYSEIITPHWEFYFDTATYNSRIANFTWTVAAPAKPLINMPLVNPVLINFPIIRLLTLVGSWIRKFRILFCP